MYAEATEALSQIPQAIPRNVGAVHKRLISIPEEVTVQRQSSDVWRRDTTRHDTAARP
jgi:hypothetical protein